VEYYTNYGYLADGILYVSDREAIEARQED
jgi:hypothetical protein